MNTRPRKMLIAAEIAPRRIGSYERSHFGVVRELESRGWNVVSAFSGEISAPVLEHFRPDGSGLVTGLGRASAAKSLRSWIRLFREVRPDVLWFHFFPTMGLFAGLTRRALPRSYIVETDHISRGMADRGPIKEVAHRARLAIASNWLDAHIAVSRFIADRLASSDMVTRDKIRVIYNGIDVDAFTPSDAPAGDFMATVCYMREEKGVGVLLDALALLKRSGVEPKCLLVGDGPCLPRYRAFARDKGLSNVEFTGLRNDVPNLLRGSRFSVVPSTWPEAFSNAAAEASALGVPVIASAIGGLREVVEDGVTGLHVPPGDVEALAAAIAHLDGDVALCKSMGRAGRERVLKYFSLRERILETANFFEGLTARPRPGLWGRARTDLSEAARLP